MLGFDTDANKAASAAFGTWRADLASARDNLAAAVADKGGSKGSTITSTATLVAAREGFLRVYNRVAKWLVAGLLAELGREAEYELFFKDLTVHEGGNPAKKEGAPPAVMTVPAEEGRRRSAAFGRRGRSFLRGRPAGLPGQLSIPVLPDSEDRSSRAIRSLLLAPPCDGVLLCTATIAVAPDLGSDHPAGEPPTGTANAFAGTARCVSFNAYTALWPGRRSAPHRSSFTLCDAGNRSRATSANRSRATSANRSRTRPRRGPIFTPPSRPPRDRCRSPLHAG